MAEIDLTHEDIPRGTTELLSYLDSKGVAFEVLTHEPAFTALQEAGELGVLADEVLKTVVVDTDAGHALLVIPASRRLDMNRVRGAVGDHDARLATEHELETDFPDYELGALPPVASLLGVPAYVDPEVMERDTVVFAAGSQTRSVRTATSELFAGEDVVVAPLARHPLWVDEPV